MTNVLDMCFKKTTVPSNNEVTFDPDMFKLLMAIDERKTIRQIAAEVQLSASAFKTSFQKLMKYKLIEPADEIKDYIEPAALEQIRKILVRLTGPLGEMLIEEAAAQLNLDPSRIPKASMADLIYTIANEIPSEKQRNEFGKLMIEEMKQMGG